MRPYAAGRLIVVFGAGGDRDAGKRPMMGAIAAEKADRAIVTDDNPRSEQPAAIRAAILQAGPGAIEIGDRGEAIRSGIAELRRGDVLLIAGKGHEAGQIIGHQTLPFSDHEAVAAALGEQDGMSERPLWSIDAMAQAMRAERAGTLPPSITGISIDTRTIAPGEAFFAIRGDARDGHDFVAAALKAGAGLAVVAADRRGEFPGDAPLLVVADVLEGLRDLARAARARTGAKVIGVTGSVGKTGTKEALRLALSADGKTHASVASYNNHWGVPLSLARCPQDARYAIFEMGMNHAGEIEPLSRLVRPQVAIITTIAPVHLEYLGSIEAIADAKAEIFRGLEPDGAALINRDIPQFARLQRAATAAGVERILSFGEHAKADARLKKYALHADCSTVQARILGDRDCLQARRARAASHPQLAGGAGGGLARGRGSRARGAGARRAETDGRPRCAHFARTAGRQRAADRRKLQRQSGFDARRARAARAGGDRPARPAHCRARRHAGAGAPGGGTAPRAGGCGGSGRGRPRILLWSVDARAVGGSSLRTPRRLCRELNCA